nr:mucin-7-like [Aegilops tauschii subsp. strangulata]
MAPPRVLVCLAIVVSLVTAAAAAKPSVLELIALAGRALQDRLAWMQPETMSASPTSRATTTAPTATSRSPPPPHAESGPASASATPATPSATSGSPPQPRSESLPASVSATEATPTTASATSDSPPPAEERTSTSSRDTHASKAKPEPSPAPPTSRGTPTALPATPGSPSPPSAHPCSSTRAALQLPSSAIRDGPPVRADSHDHHRTAGAPSAPPANQMDPPRLTTAPTCKLVSYIGGSGTDASDVFRADDGRLLVIRQGCAACGTSTATDEAINDDDALGSSEDDSDSDSNDGWESDEEGFFSEAMSKLCEGLTSFGGALEMML